MVLSVSFFGMVFGGAFLFWVFFPWPSLETEPSPNDRLAAVKKDPKSLVPDLNWRDDDLLIALTNVRLVFPKLRPMLENFNSSLPSVRTAFRTSRGSTYRNVIVPSRALRFMVESVNSLFHGSSQSNCSVTGADRKRNSVTGT